MNRFVRLAAVAALVLCPSVSAPAQEAPARQYSPEQIDRLIVHAQSGSAVIRPQAAERLASIGKPAADRLLTMAGTSLGELALLGPSLIEVLGRFDDPRFRALLWPAMEDAEFPWRPAVSRSLAHRPLPGEWDRLQGFLGDPIAPVRLATLDALALLSSGDGAERRARFDSLAVARLTDDNDVVRRRAAVLLDGRGHSRALQWLLVDLQRTDTYFDLPTGEAARYAAVNALQALDIDLAGFEAFLPPTTEPNQLALAKLRQRLLARASASESRLPEAARGLVPRTLPAIAQLGGPVEGARLGLLLKSCRRGDYYLRWTDDDQLIIGYGNPARVQLPEGTTRRLMAVADAAQEANPGKVYWGRPGCDMESFRMPRVGQPDARLQQLILSKDERPAPDLRPAALSALGAAMAASIPTDDALSARDPRTRDLARRVRGAFASIGGSVGPR
ncbi:hypothetical protein N9Z54_04615 [Planctomycetota bacterium]|jgi:hypothetical protein|nr:hypothetical protein [Planctomycetota bacterium]